MKVYIVHNQNQPHDGQQSVHLTVDAAAETVTAALLLSDYLAEDSGSEVLEINGKAWSVRDRKTIQFSALKNQREFSDRTAFMVGIDWSKNKWSDGLIPLYAVSAENKLTAVDLVKTGLVPPLVVGFNVPFASASFSECDITVNIPSSTGVCLVDGLPQDCVIESPYSTSGLVREMVIFPGLEVSAPQSSAAGDDIEFTVKVTDASGNPIQKDVLLFLESVNGLLPVNRLMTSSGQAKVKVLTNGLSAGGTVRLKAGFKFFAGAADKEVLLT
jgi:hypothetical protein